MRDEIENLRLLANFGDVDYLSRENVEAIYDALPGLLDEIERLRAVVARLG